MNVVEDKSFELAVRMVNLYNHLRDEKKEYVMLKQLLKSGTSIGANVAEAQHAQSKKDFGMKMNIALKEASETVYWLRLLFRTEYITQAEFDSVYKDADEVLALLIAICKKNL